MSRITVIGGTGYAGSAIVAEAVSRGHQVTAYSRSLPAAQIPNVDYVQGDASDEAALAGVIKGADVVVGALSPRGPIADSFQDVYRTIARITDSEKVPLYVAGGFSALRPAAGAPRYVTDLSELPPENRAEPVAVAGVLTEVLPAAPSTLDWVFVSPAQRFGSWIPGERLGRYQIGGEVALHPEDGGEISGADYALGFVDAIESRKYHRAHINIGY